jgi:hypothetical protein
MKPCVCENNGITCGGDQNYNLQHIFGKISNILDDNEKHFSKFTLSNTNISKLVENTFQEITFEYIILKNTTNLKNIESHTFSTTASKILEFEQLGDSQIGQNNYNGFSEAMSSMVNVRKITFDRNHFRNIKTRFFRNLFGEQKNLKTIDFNPNLKMIKTIESVGDFAFFYLSNLRLINFYGHKIRDIGKNAFDFFKPSNDTLEIDFSENNLNASSFKRGSFLRANRPLFINLWNNPMQYLDEKVFGPFLKRDERNKIKIGSDVGKETGFECDCRSFWFIKIKNIIKNQVNDVICKDGKSFWSLTDEDFSHCVQ